MLTETTYDFGINAVEVTMAKAARDIAVLVRDNLIDPNNLVILMGQQHEVVLLEMAQVHFVNALAENIPFKNYCSELSQDIFQKRVDNYVDDPVLSLNGAALDFAAPFGAYLFYEDGIPQLKVRYHIASLSVVNTIRQGRVNHFIDLPWDFAADGNGIFLKEPPSMDYYHRYKNSGGPLGSKIGLHDNILFTLKETDATSDFGVMQRNIQMTGRVDDILERKEGPAVVNTGLNHVHDCYGINPSLTDFLVSAGRDVVTVSFISDRYVEDGGKTYAGFCARLREQREDFATRRVKGCYLGHAYMTLA